VVPRPRTPVPARELRPLAIPEPLEVRTDRRGYPVRVCVRQRWRYVAAIQDEWEVDIEWWRPRPICRRYLRVLLEDGRCLTLFHDYVSRQWYRQTC
jgi:hypothetical protein